MWKCIDATCRFDYIVRDSRACGLGCSFQFERVMETMRVLGDEICYRAKECEFDSQELKSSFLVFYHYSLTCEYHKLTDLTIHKLFATRADLYRTVYRHAKVKVWIIPSSVKEATYCLCFINVI